MVVDLGLLLALLGFDTRMADPERCPLEPREDLLVAWETDVWLETSSRKVSWGWENGRAPGACAGKVECIIVQSR